MVEISWVFGTCTGTESSAFFASQLLIAHRAFCYTRWWRKPKSPFDTFITFRHHSNPSFGLRKFQLLLSMLLGSPRQYFFSPQLVKCRFRTRSALAWKNLAPFFFKSLYMSSNILNISGVRHGWVGSARDRERAVTIFTKKSVEKRYSSKVWKS